MLNLDIIRNAQQFLRRENISGWLVYDYLTTNPVFGKIIIASGHVTRPRFIFIPATGTPSLLAHHVDAGKYASPSSESDSLLQYRLLVYSSRTSLVELLKETLSTAPIVAMEYSRFNQLPRVSRVDAGTIELIQDMGSKVVSSQDLLQYATQRWTTAQLESHLATAQKLGNIVNEAFKFIETRLQKISNIGIKWNPPTEFEIAEFIRMRFKEEGLESPDGPIVSVNSHCSDPHYEPSSVNSSEIENGDWILIDLWARKSGSPDNVYADITWTAYVGDKVPDDKQKVFDIVISARDIALQYLKDCHREGKQIQGFQVDEVARNYIAIEGYGNYFTHRLGHSISETVHGEAVNLDNFETHDSRLIIPGIGFSIEPGIYLPDFGVRSEIDAYMSEDGPYATSPVQSEIVLIKPSL
ncbi:MAG: M24 family metallopeptidase [Chloroflexota bacterium]|nr:M24 family metallopeptidase [Chloroflexota bacterium]